jgi:hypothetical protein
MNIVSETKRKEHPMNTIHTMKKILIATVAATAIAALITPVSAMAEDAPAKSAPSTRANGPQENFRAAFGKFTTKLEEVRKDLAEVTRQMDDTAKATPESRLGVVNGMKEQLVELGTVLEPGRPFAEALERYDSWVGAQISRLNRPDQREVLGTEFVEERLGGYRKNQAETAAAREFLVNQRKNVNRTLQELSTAQWRVAELLLAAESDEAVRALRDTLSKIEKALDDIRSEISRHGTAGV